MARPLLIVDVQNGFINDFTHHIPDRVARLIDTQAFEPLLFTRFVNAPGSPYQRLLEWHDSAEPPDTELVPELERFVAEGNVYVKRGLAGMPQALADRLTRDGIEEIDVVGIDTDMCVLKIALDLFDAGIEPVVLVDCCASTAGLQAHLAGLAILSRNIGPYQLRLTELHAGYLSAPRGDPTPS